jgi:hypothetical protein
MDMSVQNGIGATVLSALQTASRTTGIDFGYLAATAKRESAFDPEAKAPTSSATGLFQFIDQTWLQVLRDAGPELGYAEQAQAIETRADGTLRVPDSAKRAEIMELRKDPVAASLMAGALTQSNGAHLQNAIGRPPNDGELYIAHFLGASGASRLITTAEASPDANAARMFPAAAKANRSIFYERDGSARNVAEVHQQLISKHLETQNAALALSGGGPASAEPSQSSFSGMASHVPDPTMAVSRIPALENGAGGGVFADLFRPAVGQGLSNSAQHRLAMTDNVQSLFTSTGTVTSPNSGMRPPRVEPVVSPVNTVAISAQDSATPSAAVHVPVFEPAPMPARLDVAGHSEPQRDGRIGVDERQNARQNLSQDARQDARASQPDLFQRMLDGIAGFFGIRST